MSNPLPPLPIYPPRPFSEAGPAPSFQNPPPPPQMPPPPPPGERPNSEVVLGRWLAPVGVVFAVLTLISFSTLAYDSLYQYLGPWSKLGILTLVSAALVAGGLELERRSEKLAIYGSTLAAGGLACLYYTLYGANYVSQLQVITNPVLGGYLLLAWSAGVLYLAEQKKSELLSVFSIGLAYFSSGITPLGHYTLVADLLLAVTSVVFLVRNSWAGLSYICLIGTYVGFLHQFVSLTFAQDWSYVIHTRVDFVPSAGYLAGAWLIYTSGVLLTKPTSFRGAQRMIFLCLNNGALALLLPLTAYLTGFPYISAIFCVLGGAYLLAAWVAIYLEDSSEISQAYLLQGVALFTGGLVSYHAGLTRGLLLTGESLFLAAASRNIILRIGAYLCALAGTVLIIIEVNLGNDHPIAMVLAGTVILCTNAWLARHESGKSTNGGSIYYAILASGLVLLGLVAPHVHDVWMAPALACIALALTLAIYLVPLYELPIIGQVLLVAAQIIALTNSGPVSPAVVLVVSLIISVWWTQQTCFKKTGWLEGLQYFYAINVMALTFAILQLPLSSPHWMAVGCACSLAYLAYGAASRNWPFILASQLFLGLAIAHSFSDASSGGNFTGEALVPPITLLIISFLIPPLGKWMKLIQHDESCTILSLVYQVTGFVLGANWVLEIAPASVETCFLLVASSGFLAWNIYRQNIIGARIGLVLDVAALGTYLYRVGNGMDCSFTWLDTMGFLCLLSQPVLVQKWGEKLFSLAEQWAVILISSGMSWLYLSLCLQAAGSHIYALAWSLLALAITVFGFITNEPRQRWCGLIILLAALGRVALYDFWGFSDLGRFLTFFSISSICLGLSFVYYKFGDRLRQWV